MGYINSFSRKTRNIIKRIDVVVQQVPERHVVNLHAGWGSWCVPPTLYKSIFFKSQIMSGIRIWGRLNIKMSSYQYRDPHVKDKTVSRPSYLSHGDPDTRERRSLYWEGGLDLNRAILECTLSLGTISQWHPRKNIHFTLSTILKN